MFTATKSQTDTGGVWFSFNRVDRRVICYYFYLWDDDFGPAFIKLSNGFASATDVRACRTSATGSARPVGAKAGAGGSVDAPPD